MITVQIQRYDHLQCRTVVSEGVYEKKPIKCTTGGSSAMVASKSKMTPSRTEVILGENLDHAGPL
jgi:hypothetical protein